MSRFCQVQASLHQLVLLFGSSASAELRHHFDRRVAEFPKSDPMRADFLLRQMLHADHLVCHDRGGSSSVDEYSRAFGRCDLWARRALTLAYLCPRNIPLQPPPERVRAAERVFLRELRKVRDEAADGRRQAMQLAGRLA